MAELITNSYTTLLNMPGGLFPATTVIDVVSASGWPATGDFRLLIDEELLLVTSVTGTTLTVTRGAEGTTAAYHAHESRVFNLLTAGALNLLATELPNPMTNVNDMILGATAGAASRLPVGTPGQIIKYVSPAVGWHNDNAVIGAVFNGGGSVITTPLTVDLHLAYYAKILTYTLTGFPAGTATVLLQNCAYANYNGGVTHPSTGDDITGGNNAVITSSAKAQDTTLSGWSTTLNTDSILRIQLSSCSVFTNLSLALQVSKGAF